MAHDFEDDASSVVTKTKKGGFQTSGVLTMASGHAVHDTYTAFLAPLLPMFIEKFSLSLASAGLLSVFMQGPSIIQPIIGHFADKRNLKFIVILAPAAASVLMSLLGVAPGYISLAVLLILTGIISAGMHAVGPVMAGQLSGSKLGRGMSFWMLGGELGRTLGPVIVVSVVVHFTLDGLPVLMIAGLFISLILYIRLKDVPGIARAHKEQENWRTALKNMRFIFIPLVGIITVRAFLHAALTIYLPTFLTMEGANLWLAGASLTILQAAGAVGAFVGGSISDRFGRRRVMLISLICAPVLMFIFLAVESWLQLLTLIGLGFFVISFTPVFMALVQENFPENRSLANGVYMCCSFVLRSIVIVAVGSMGDAIGLRSTFIVCAFLMILGIPILFFLPKGN